jgi:hypothetical protein
MSYRPPYAGYIAPSRKLKGKPETAEQKRERRERTAHRLRNDKFAGSVGAEEARAAQVTAGLAARKERDKKTVKEGAFEVGYDVDPATLNPAEREDRNTRMVRSARVQSRTGTRADVEAPWRGNAGGVFKFAVKAHDDGSSATGETTASSKQQAVQNALARWAQEHGVDVGLAKYMYANGKVGVNVIQTLGVGQPAGESMTMTFNLNGIDETDATDRDNVTVKLDGDNVTLTGNLEDVSQYGSDLLMRGATKL